MSKLEMSSVAQADKTFLGNRFEFKYILDPVKAHKVEEYIRAVGLRTDPNSQRGPYRVNSFYFDTPTMGDYMDKDGSYLIRKKMRARCYIENWDDNPERVWLEVKKKRNMNIKKLRIGITGSMWQKLVAGDLSSHGHSFSSESEEKMFEEFMYYYRCQLYRPSAIVKYFRTAYIGEFLKPIRVTFDRDVRACRADGGQFERHMRHVSSNQTIMEIKFNGKLPWWFTEMLTRFDIQRQDFSKYRNAVAMIRGLDRIPISK